MSPTLLDATVRMIEVIKIDQFSNLIILNSLTACSSHQRTS